MVLNQKTARPKPISKVVINYPPVPTKKWIPPDNRPKKPRPEPVYKKPEGITQKLAVSSLNKVWHQFQIVGDRALILADYSQTHGRFEPKSNGFQGTANCLVACAFAEVYQMSSWSKEIIHRILNLGDKLYLKSLNFVTNKCKVRLSVEEIYQSFYIQNKLITMELVNRREVDISRKSLAPIFSNFFQYHQTAVMTYQNEAFAIWKKESSYFIFDPSENDKELGKWRGAKGFGYCYLVKYQRVEQLDRHLMRKLFNNKSIVPGILLYIYPCGILRTTNVDVKAPEKFEDIEAKQPPVSSQIVPSSKQDKPTKKKNDKVTQPQVVVDVPQEKKLSEPKTVTHFTGQLPSGKILPKLADNSWGILRATTHQNDVKFTKYNGQQSFANAISALSHLRLYKSKLWLRQTVDDILRHAEQIHHDTVKTAPKSRDLELCDVKNRICLNDQRTFLADIVEFALIGKLQSKIDGILDLHPALVEFFYNNDCCVIVGPLIVAVWLEDGIYYLFDPNERDANGRNQNILMGPSAIPGVACVVWFKDLKQLVALYFNNIPKNCCQEQFYISRVIINDFISLPDSWHNFVSIMPDKWILRGTFNQSHRKFSKESRNTQCTANAAMALVYAKLVEVHEWTTDTVDQVLMSGDELYRTSVETLKEINKYIAAMLMVDELNRVFVVQNQNINLEVTDCLINGLVVTRNNNPNTLNLQRGCDEFFRDSTSGVLTSHGISVAIWKNENHYFYFDSHSRDEKGLACPFGQACLLRMLTIADLAKAIASNLSPRPTDFFNISRVIVKTFELDESGVVKPDLNHYQAIDNSTDTTDSISGTIAILRSLFSCNDPKYKLNRGKQTIPMCLVALGMAKMMPSSEWTIQIVDTILDLGDALYIRTMEKIEEERNDLEGNMDLNEAQFLEDDEEAADNVTADNVQKDYQIGNNRIDIEFVEDLVVDPIEQEHLKETLNMALPTTTSEIILESFGQTVAVWRDDNFWYMFDPKPRNEQGEIYGKDEWSAIIEDDELLGEEEEEEGEDEEDIISSLSGVYDQNDDGAGGDNFGEQPQQQLNEDDDDDKIEANEGEISGGDMESQDLNQGFIVEAKHSASFWRLQEDEAGKGCVLLFSTLDRLCRYLIDNIPPQKRDEIYIRIKTIQLRNNSITSKKTAEDFIQAEEVEPEVDKDLGDWFDFKEITYLQWILRGSDDLTNKLFSAKNRGKQTIPMCFTAIAYADIYSLERYHSSTVDSILAYGDRLYTFMRRLREKDLRKNNDSLRLTEDEINQILTSCEPFKLNEYIRQFCIAETLVKIDSIEEQIMGDLKAKNLDGLLGVAEGLERFFEDHQYGILMAKDLEVAIWRDESSSYYYMFDPKSRGPNGVKLSANGVACITRQKACVPLADLFLANLARDHGHNMYTISSLTITKSDCPRTKQPEMEPCAPKPPIIMGYNNIIAGKDILRGDLLVGDRDIGQKSAAIAFIALAMTLTNKSENWTRSLVDEIILLGETLYIDSVDALGVDFNPWEDQLDVYRIKTDSYLGLVKVNWQLRYKDQKGIVDNKKQQVEQNLRQGIEKFFEENTHGVIVVMDSLTVALWEEDEDKDAKKPYQIYIFDPNPRGSTGLPHPNGKACVLKFCNAKLASDHLLDCIVDKNARYTILPLEIVVGDTKQKTIKKSKCKQKDETLKLPRCEKMIESEQKRKLRMIAAEERARKLQIERELIGRRGFHMLSNQEAILRGDYSQFNISRFGERCSGNQDIPMNIMSLITFKMIPDIDSWNHIHINQMLKSGNQLYIDSYVVYKDANAKLGLENILRKIYVNTVQVRMVMYKPIIYDGGFTSINLGNKLERVMNLENHCILNYARYWVTIFSKGRYFYLFIPYDRDENGDRVGALGTGSACILRYDSLMGLVDRLVRDYGNASRSTTFSVVLLKLCGI